LVGRLEGQVALNGLPTCSTTGKSEKITMADPRSPQQAPRTKWLWVGLVVVLAFLLIAVLFNPSGDRDGTVNDPIVIEDMGEGTGLGEPTGTDTSPPPEPFAPGGEPAN
jgi:hypothetical protein